MISDNLVMFGVLDVSITVRNFNGSKRLPERIDNKCTSCYHSRTCFVLQSRRLQGC